MKKIRLYSTNICPFCSAAKQLLKQLKLDFEEINLEDQPELRMQLSRENGGWRTVPMIFLGDEFVGGFQELSGLHRNGTLMEKLQN